MDTEKVHDAKDFNILIWKGLFLDWKRAKDEIREVFV